MLWQTTRTNIQFIKPDAYVKHKIISQLFMSVHTNTRRKKTKRNNNTNLSLPVHVKM